jgi:hypothetical protein
MQFHNINLVAVLVCAVSSFIIGGIWYSPVLFARSWAKELGKSPEDFKKSSPLVPMLISFLASIVIAFVMAHIIVFADTARVVHSLRTNIETAILLWGGFTAATSFVNKGFEGYSMTLWAINVGYRLVDFIAMAVILTLMP